MFLNGSMLPAQAGANTVNDIAFAVSEKKLQDVKNNLLKEAVANAKSKADIVASAVGLHVAGNKIHYSWRSKFATITCTNLFKIWWF